MVRVCTAVFEVEQREGTPIKQNRTEQNKSAQTYVDMPNNNTLSHTYKRRHGHRQYTRKAMHSEPFIICGGGQGLSHSSDYNILKHIPCFAALERMMDRAFIKATVHMFGI